MNYLSNELVDLSVPKFRFRLKAELATISIQNRVIVTVGSYTPNNCCRTVTSTESFPAIPVINAVVQ